MNFKKTFICLVGVGSLVTSATCFAVTAASRGFYVEGNIGTAKLFEDSLDSTFDKSVKVDKNTGVGWDINAGYKFFKYFAVEGGYNNYPRETIVQSTDQPFTGHTDNWATDVAAKGILPLNDSGFSLFAKAGLAWVHHYANSDGLPDWNYSKEGIACFGGIGMSFAVVDHLEVTAQVNSTTRTGSIIFGDTIPAMAKATVGVTLTF